MVGIESRSIVVLINIWSLLEPNNHFQNTYLNSKRFFFFSFSRWKYSRSEGTSMPFSTGQAGDCTNWFFEVNVKFRWILSAINTRVETCAFLLYFLVYCFLFINLTCQCQLLQSATFPSHTEACSEPKWWRWWMEVQFWDIGSLTSILLYMFLSGPEIQVSSQVPVLCKYVILILFCYSFMYRVWVFFFWAIW